MYKTIIPVLSYVSETWTLNKREIEKCLVFKRKILRTIFASRKDMVTGNGSTEVMMS